MDSETGLALSRDYISKSSLRKDGLEPYPISLRGINWIKFLSRFHISDASINALLYEDYCHLSRRPEYHLMGNHLLENGLSLLFGAFYFRDEKLYSKATRILTTELKEQVLQDGAHFELSPMYNQLILNRVLDAIALLRQNRWKTDSLLSLLEDTGCKMLGWLEAIRWNSGDIPHVNDATSDIAPTSGDLEKYARDLRLQTDRIALGESGYRKFNRGYFEVLVDAGQILPPYQPGHAHADSLQVLLQYNDTPVLVDTGISTYEKNQRRQLERSTSSHNTVSVDSKDSSQVWGGFRVGKRARVRILEETPQGIRAAHNGYGFPLYRTVKVASNEIILKDKINGAPGSSRIQGHLHFPPDSDVTKSGNTLVLGNLIFKFSGVTSVTISEYAYAWGFNNRQKAPKVLYEFKDRCTIRIRALDPIPPRLTIV